MSTRTWCSPLSPRALALLAAAGVVVLVGSFQLAWSGKKGAGAWDIPVYQRYASRIEGDELPYRDFRVEYPPGALPFFVPPSEVLRPTRSPTWEPVMNPAARRYARAFALEMVSLLAITLIVTALSLAALGASLAQAVLALGLLAVSPLLLGDLVFTRFDVWPALLTAVAIGALLRERFRLAGLALGIGIATKLYPALLVPLAVAYAWRRRGRREGLTTLALTAIAAAAVILPFLALAPEGIWWPIREQLGRGLQGESSGASALAALHVATLHLRDYALPLPTFPLDFVGSAGPLHSPEVQGASGTATGILSGLVSLAILVWAWVTFARGPASPSRLALFAAIVVTAQVAVGRVLSPQFVIWLLPIVPLVGGRRGLTATGLLAGVLLATHLWFPGPYRDYVEGVSAGDAGSTGLLVLRNALLLATLLTLVLPRPPWRRVLVARPTAAR
jgi:Glycosyltransferase family 87